MLLERGITAAQGRRKFEKAVDAMLADEAALVPGRLRELLLDMRAEWAELDRRIDAFDQEFVQLARTDEVARRLTSIPGFGALNATGSLPRLAERKHLTGREILEPGSSWFRDSTQPAESRACWGSANKGTPTCGRC